MLRCETASAAPRDIEDLAVLVSQLAALGIEARIDARGIPQGLARNVQFDLAPYLTDTRPAPSDQFLVTAAQRATDAGLAGLRRLVGTEECLAHACGAFRDRQARVAARAKLGYVLGAEPKIINLADPGDPGWEAGCPVIGVAPRPAADIGRPRLLIVAPDLADPADARDLADLAMSRRFETAILTDGKSKEEWRASRGAELKVYHYGEALPLDLAAIADICVLRAPLSGNYRLRSLVANLAVTGGVLIDATEGHVLAAREPAFVRAPVRTPALHAFLAETILPRRETLGEATRASRLAVQADPEPMLRMLGLTRRPRDPGKPVTAFMPTNGVGLGHAQRCGLIGSEMTATRPVFAAFPSCLRLIKSYGFDVMPLIGRSDVHAQTHENDLANYLRLRALTAGAGTVVFDGGYVFDSVYRTILENRLNGIWIRRGLWQSGQDNSIALDREKIFDRVIVPAEAFAELNASYSHGDHVREVGPIVRPRPPDPAARSALRARLAERFGVSFERLVVSLLGGGVAADRGAQIQALCGMMERRADTLHLIIVWPTGVTCPSWFSWRNSRVVRTDRAGVIAAAADLCVSAAGYNSFHETLYNRVPTIFVPQTAAFMDDQRARARAARDREVAAMVEPHALMTLDREVARILDEGLGETFRARLSELDLPAPGAAEAARLIEEFTDGSHALDHDPVTDRLTGRGRHR
ncbi:glycosyltransferase [Amaricoccus sp. W119]|uniref:glycosyltransferase n=1 Tax=Amaricoccus sp. W119 TaxID=3391833 RepID=UPI0039A4666B